MTTTTYAQSSSGTVYHRVLREADGALITACRRKIAAGKATGWSGAGAPDKLCKQCRTLAEPLNSAPRPKRPGSYSPPPKAPPAGGPTMADTSWPRRKTATRTELVHRGAVHVSERDRIAERGEGLELE